MKLDGFFFFLIKLRIISYDMIRIIADNVQVILGNSYFRLYIFIIIYYFVFQVVVEQTKYATKSKRKPRLYDIYFIIKT